MKRGIPYESVFLLTTLSVMLAVCSSKNSASRDSGAASTTDRDSGGSGPDSGEGNDSGEDSGGGEEPPCDRSVDRDCDGVEDDLDCLPDDETAYPGATEIPYDGVDNDCLGDGDLVDVDGDGYVGVEVGGDDCDDSEPEAFPGAEEVCNGRDDNCDGWPAEPDEELNDCDRDGYGPGSSGDCDDADPEVNPAAEEVWYDGQDRNCNGDNDFDADGDGDESASFSTAGGDCDDADPDVNSDTTELLNGVDDDCDSLVDTIRALDADAVYNGTTSSGDGWTGMDIASLGDIDGDGWADYAMGGPFGDSDGANCTYADASTGVNCNGWVQLMSGAEGSSDPPGTVAHGVIEGNNSWLGWTLDAIGDVNSDGRAELLVGAPGAGAVFLFDGGDLSTGGSISQSDAIASYSGGTYYGFEVSHLRDVDGDGLPEVIASEGFSDETIASIPTNLAVWASSTTAGGSYTESDASFRLIGSSAGGEVAGAADFNGDGRGDLAVGDAVDAAGILRMVSGDDLTSNSVATVADYSGPAGVSGDQFGTHLTLLGDVDGDGLDDLAASGPTALGQAAFAEGGIVRILSGADLFSSTSAADDAIFVIHGTLDYGRLGLTGSMQGDLDGDGGTDLVVPYLGGSTIGVVVGSSHIFYAADLASGGTVVAEDTSAALTTRSASDRFGYGGEIVDIDGDGADDIVVGAFAGSSDRGMVVKFLSGW